MVRSTLLFGNGLGMAIDSDIYSLEQALHKTWRDDDILDDDDRAAIRACLPDPGNNSQPDTEDDLDKLQQVLSACDFLNDIQLDEQEHWLSLRGQAFPAAIRKFLHRTSASFVNTNCELPESFMQPLAEHIKKSKSHVATLNYDDLLYEGLIQHDILCGYDGASIDGITRAGFKAENLNRRKPAGLGWYLHLHGSPLFYDAPNGLVRKLTRGEFNRNNDVDSTHIVLTHVRHKPAIISSSKILTEYWKRLRVAIKESDNIILFGYSGCDSHLNDLVVQTAGDKNVLIVEWSGTGKQEDREKYWKERLGIKLELARLSNILDFTEW